MGFAALDLWQGVGLLVVVFSGYYGDAPARIQCRRVLVHALVDQDFRDLQRRLIIADDQIRSTSDFAGELPRINRTALRLSIDNAATFAARMLENRQWKVCLEEPAAW